MADNDAGQGVTVSCRDCRCPGGPDASGHLVDEVYLIAEPSLHMGIAAQFAFRDSIVGNELDDEVATLKFTDVFVKYGVTGWNLTDENGPRPLDLSAITDDMSLGLPVADKAAELYMEKVTAPLVKRLATTLPSGQTVSSSSARNGSTPKRPGSSSRRASAASKPLTA